MKHYYKKKKKKKTNGGDGVPSELFDILSYYAVKVWHSTGQQI